MSEDKKGAGLDTKKVLKDLAEKKVKVKFTDRKKVEILKDTKHYKKGQVVNPHVTFADALISEKIAKEIKQ